MKVLNLYAGIRGNRKLWEDVEVTAVENNESIAKVYQDYFPDDEMIIGDAHQYLLDHFKEFDFIWSSPPCPTHSRVSINFAEAKQGQIIPRYPDMKLWQEIIFLKYFFNGKYCVENVVPYYKPLEDPQQFERHLFWCNFRIIQKTTRGKKHMVMLNQIDKRNGRKRYAKDVAKEKGIDRSDVKAQWIQNMVDPETALMILNCARNIITKSVHQTELFN